MLKLKEMVLNQYSDFSEGDRVIFNGQRGAGSVYGAGFLKGTEFTVTHLRFANGNLLFIEAQTDDGTSSRFSPNQLDKSKHS